MQDEIRTEAEGVMQWIYDDGGRAADGYTGSAGDCVARAVAIASGRSYADVYAALARGAGRERGSRGTSARNGIHTSRAWFKTYMSQLGFRWTPTMHIGSGCRVHLTDGELPNGRLVVAVSRHVTAVLDGVIHDTHDPQRGNRRCVYGYYSARQEGA